MWYIIAGKIVSLVSYYVFYKVLFEPNTLSVFDQICGWFLIEHIFEDYEKTAGKFFITNSDFRNLIKNFLIIIRNIVFWSHMLTLLEFLLILSTLFLLIFILSYFFKTKQLGVYKKTRNGLVGTDYSSKFSAWLANGSLSTRTIYWNIKQFEKEHYKNESTYWLIFELIWRDYFKYISLKHGNDIFKIGGILKHDYHWHSEKKTH